MTTVLALASWNADLVLRLPRPLAVGETAVATSFETLPGGKGSNAAIAAARQGAQVSLIARIGDDAHGQMGQALWQREGIATEHVVVAAGEASGIAQIWVYDSGAHQGDNNIAVFAGANAGLDASHVASAQATLRSARVVMASNEVPLNAVIAAFRLARDSGITTLFNPAPAPDPTGAQWQQVLALTDVLTPNETEFERLFVNESALARHYPSGLRAVVMTQGAIGCTLHTPEGVQQFAGHAVQVADTVGAGDTFTGTLASALARGEALSLAVRLANAAAACSVQARGAIAGMPTLAQAQALAGLHRAC